MKDFTYPVEVVNVHDGDTVTANIDLGFSAKIVDRQVRINGIDTPEIRTKNKLEKEAGLAVRDFVSELLTGTDGLILKSEKLDKYGRVLGDIIVDNVLLSELLLSMGYALRYDGGTKSKFSTEMLNKIINTAEGKNVK